MNILIIDDSVHIRNGLVRLVRAFGHDVTVAVNGMQGVEFARTAHFDLVMTDLNLRDKDGKDGMWVIEQIRGFAPASRIWLMSSYMSEMSMVRARELGAERSLDKLELASRAVELFSK